MELLKLRQQEKSLIKHSKLVIYAKDKQQITANLLKCLADTRIILHRILLLHTTMIYMTGMSEGKHFI